MNRDVATLLAALRFFAEGIANGTVSNTKLPPKEALIYVLTLSIKVKDAVNELASE